ncbi:MAG: hypothetical protein IPK11_14540 [Ignavibacteria bacterium]|nr:hypothetical protein [Ignavibacteria bacterium]HRI30074.1 hypothetical protein [Candidatus Kapabacteria bacterium]
MIKIEKLGEYPCASDYSFPGVIHSVMKITLHRQIRIMFVSTMKPKKMLISLKDQHQTIIWLYIRWQSVCSAIFAPEFLLYFYAKT